MNRQKIKELIELVESSAIAELEVHFFGGRKVVIRKNSTAPVISQPAQAAAEPAPVVAPIQQSAPPAQVAPPAEMLAAPIVEAAATQYVQIVAPMVGTFYRRPSPDSPPYAGVGDQIEVGQVICLIEAMKLFNEVKSEVSGKIVKFAVEDGSPVEFGQLLALVEPA